MELLNSYNTHNRPIKGSSLWKMRFQATIIALVMSSYISLTEGGVIDIPILRQIKKINLANE